MIRASGVLAGLREIRTRHEYSQDPDNIILRYFCRYEYKLADTRTGSCIAKSRKDLLVLIRFTDVWGSLIRATWFTAPKGP
eukprot:scaffold472565_cov11-Prasinocladus_malaysianus.AAC.1